jgi:hypothetical protein
MRAGRSVSSRAPGSGVNHVTAGGQLNGAGRYLVSAFGNLAIDAGSVTIRNLQIDPSKIGAVKIGAASVSGPTPTPKISDGRDHTDAIEAVSLTSVKIGGGSIFKTLAAPVYLDAGGDDTEDLGDIVVRKI